MQRYLLDTQVLIWALTNPSRLPPDIVHLLSTNAICISQVSFFEIAIKQKIGKLPELPVSITELEEVVLRDGFGLLPIATAHIAAYDAIVLHETHRDPFDRLILATAYAEKMPVISADSNFNIYKALVSVIEI